MLVGGQIHYAVVEARIHFCFEDGVEGWVNGALTVNKDRLNRRIF